MGLGPGTNVAVWLGSLWSHSTAWLGPRSNATGDRAPVDPCNCVARSPVELCNCVAWSLEQCYWGEVPCGAMQLCGWVPCGAIQLRG